MKKVDCRISTVELQGDDILYIQIMDHEIFEVNDFYEIKRAALKLGQGKSFYHLIKVGESTTFKKKAYEASFSLEGSYYKKAEAYVITTVQQRLVMSLMIKLNNPAVPTRIFKSEEEALTWLSSIQSKEMALEIAEN